MIRGGRPAERRCRRGGGAFSGLEGGKATAASISGYDRSSLKGLKRGRCVNIIVREAEKMGRKPRNWRMGFNHIDIVPL
jgi:hypothetical protein